MHSSERDALWTLEGAGRGGGPVVRMEKRDLQPVHREKLLEEAGLARLRRNLIVLTAALKRNQRSGRFDGH